MVRVKGGAGAEGEEDEWDGERAYLQAQAGAAVREAGGWQWPQQARTSALALCVVLVAQTRCWVAYLL